MKIRGRKHRVDEVIKQLERKGCNITGSVAITKRFKTTERASKSQVEDKYELYLKAVGEKNIAIKTMELGRVKAHDLYFNRFKSKNKSLFEGKEVWVENVIQPAYCVNIKQARDLGNKSWGKIDFLVNHNGYSVQRQ